MTDNTVTASTPLPRPRHIKSPVLHAVAQAATALTSARSRATVFCGQQNRLLDELEHAKNEIALLSEELSIKDARWSRLSSRRRPHYMPIERMRIVQLKAARGWTRDEAARRFLVNEETMLSWLRPVKLSRVTT